MKTTHGHSAKSGEWESRENQREGEVQLEKRERAWEEGQNWELSLVFKQ